MKTNITVQQGVEEFLDYRRARLAASTVLNDTHMLRRFVRNVGGDRQIRYLTARVVEDWFYGVDGIMADHRTKDRQLRPSVQASTHNFYRTRLKALFAFWTKRGYLKVDLLVDVDPQKIVRKQRQQPSPDLLWAMLDATSNRRDRAFLACAINTALRANEILRLRWKDLDLDGGWLTVFISKTRVEDRLPITSDLDAELRTWLTAYGQDLGRPFSPDDHLFPAKGGNRFTQPRLVEGVFVQENVPHHRWLADKPMSHPERMVQEALAAVGLPTKFEGVHTLRRAVARHYFDSLVASELGYDGALRTVSAWLHHSSTQVTEIYLGLTAERC